MDPHRHTVAQVLVFCLLMFSGTYTAHAQDLDPTDSLLRAYALSDSEAALFSMSDGKRSEFWGSTPDQDIAIIYPPDYCYPGRCLSTDALDAGLVVRAAATPQALYLYLEVTDNEFVNRVDQTDWGADCIDLYLDELSSQEIWDCTDCLIGLYESKLTYSTEQFQTWLAADTALPIGCLYMDYGDELWGGMQPVGLTWEQLRQLYQVEAEPVYLTPHYKIIEMRIPWQHFDGAFPPGTPLASRRLAMTAGYNDKDGDTTEPGCIRWLGKDPWSGDQNYWGDILLPASLGPVDTVAMAVVPRVSHGLSSPATVCNTVYDLRGRRVHGSVPSAGLALRRYVTGRSAVTVVESWNRSRSRDRRGSWRS